MNVRILRLIDVIGQHVACHGVFGTLHASSEKPGVYEIRNAAGIVKREISEADIKQINLVMGEISISL